MSSSITRSAAFLVLATLPAAAQIQFQTLPAGLDATIGNSGSTEPFFATERQIHHWVYDAAEFQATQPVRIRSIAMRPSRTSRAGGRTPSSTSRSRSRAR